MDDRPLARVRCGCYLYSMSRIIGVHGMGAQQVGSDQLSADWRLALRGGLRKAKRPDLADGLSDNDVRVVHYGDLFFDPNSMGDTPSVSDLTEADREMLRRLYEAALERDPGLGASEGGMGAVGFPPINAILRKLVSSRFFGGVTQRLFMGNLRQVNRFLDDPALKSRVFDRMDELVTIGTRVIIGHSLGSIVAYEYLCARPLETPVKFLTIGSPLGMRNVIFDRLTPAPRNGKGTWPSGVSSWTNVADTDDIVALEQKLSGRFPHPPGLDKIDDRLVNNEDEPHSAERYLVKTVVGESLAKAL